MEQGGSRRFRAWVLGPTNSGAKLSAVNNLRGNSQLEETVSLVRRPADDTGSYSTRPSASIVSSTVSNAVVSNLERAPPALIAMATAAIDTLSGASQRLYASYSPRAYQNP